MAWLYSTMEGIANDSSNLQSRIEDLEKTIENIKNNMTLILSQNKHLKNKISKLTGVIYQVQNDQYGSEVKFIQLSQYSRRENTEFHNVPESIEQKDLEEHILSALSSINIVLQHYDIVAVHRIGKITHGTNRKVLLRFINRKHAFRCLKNSRKLKHSTNIIFKNYFITENLCPDNRQIFNKCYKLKKRGEIFNVWTYNGAVYIKFSENEDIISINHFDDIEWYIVEGNNSFSDSD